MLCEETKGCTFKTGNENNLFIFMCGEYDGCLIIFSLVKSKCLH